MKSSTAHELRGLYAIADASLLTANAILPAVNEAIAGGAKLIQYREKGQHGRAATAIARQLASSCRASGVYFIVNDDVELALNSGADGVHLGQDDAAISHARQRLGSARIIGASCYNSLPLAAKAAAAGADYLAFGRFFPSKTKPDAPNAELATLAAARAQFDLPLCAIGGITASNAEPLLAAGADLIAAVDGVFGAANISIAAAHYQRLFG